MPVEPSSSRLRMARTMSSWSPPRNWPAAARLSTICRTTASFEEAFSDGRIAFRQTKSLMRMAGVLRSLLGAGPGGLPGVGGAPVILDLLLVAPQLRLQLVQRHINGGHHVGVGL